MFILFLVLTIRLDCLKGAKLFSSKDIRSGYWQIEIDEVDCEKTALPPKDYMNLNSCRSDFLATFERMMDNLLRHFKWLTGLCYLDDIIVFSETLQDHLIRLERVLKCLQKACLVLNPNKCLLQPEKLKYWVILYLIMVSVPIPTK
ncbi:transposon Ty3-I Gag-Pol polyprotein [Trichonephila clavata]|uniref:Transposon Ty3-I Gag-Pol polyprotein n=1 Tax=Trichonephila clavata TaxID=2740835 RepID=A0A8X6G999_TRICU|nr:transposon Ty3-I Gag-Pol polyprotein [Trichonephila clavata]